ncbi:barstar family protein [Paenibacillus sp. GSMTC-2017]|nr:barstar family protein [Paenibacillus sp. GSMTC-2017]
MNGSIVKFWSQSILDKTIQNIREEGFEINCFDCESWDKNNCLLEIGKTLEFPSYYGGNLAAFNDCLSDVYPSDEGIVFVFKNFDRFNERDSDMAHEVLDIIQNNSWRLLIQHQKKLIAFLLSNDPHLQFQKVGALSILWNNAEWMNKNRGV